MGLGTLTNGNVCFYILVTTRTKIVTLALHYRPLLVPGLLRWLSMKELALFII